MNTLEILTAFILSIFIVFRIRLPPSVVKIISTLFGKIVVVLLVIYLFYENFILGILGTIVIYEMLKQTVKATVRIPVAEAVLPASTQFPTTLEETIVNSIVPLVQSDSPPHLNFKYSQEDIHDAAMV